MAKQRRWYRKKSPLQPLSASCQIDLSLASNVWLGPIQQLLQLLGQIFNSRKASMLSYAATASTIEYWESVGMTRSKRNPAPASSASYS